MKFSFVDIGGICCKKRTDEAENTNIQTAETKEINKHKNQLKFNIKHRIPNKKVLPAIFRGTNRFRA
jgi:hypothetical protein